MFIDHVLDFQVLKITRAVDCSVVSDLLNDIQTSVKLQSR